MEDKSTLIELTAEIGLWGYDAVPADPFVLNHRNFPTATMLGDAAMVLPPHTLDEKVVSTIRDSIPRH